MLIKIKRVYDKPTRADGTRILADRLWPRGVSKKDAEIIYWAKELTPSNELRSWYHKDPEKRFTEFKKKYKIELKKNKTEIQKNLQATKKTITLITAVKDIPHSHIPTLKGFLEQNLLKKSRSATRSGTVIK